MKELQTLMNRNGKEFASDAPSPDVRSAPAQIQMWRRFQGLTS